MQISSYQKQRIYETNKKNLLGKIFGFLTVIEETAERKNRSIVWKCFCRCGNIVSVITSSLTTGHTKSCGCYREELRELWRQIDTPLRIFRRKYEKARITTERQRTPKWADLAAIRQFYYNCPENFSVDHIIPLRGKLVSGLHTLENLTYMTPSENSRKSNKFNPYIESK